MVTPPGGAYLMNKSVCAGGRCIAATVGRLRENQSSPCGPCAEHLASFRNHTHFVRFRLGAGRWQRCRSELTLRSYRRQHDGCDPLAEVNRVRLLTFENQGVKAAFRNDDHLLSAPKGLSDADTLLIIIQPKHCFGGVCQAKRPAHINHHEPKRTIALYDPHCDLPFKQEGCYVVVHVVLQRRAALASARAVVRRRGGRPKLMSCRRLTGSLPAFLSLDAFKTFLEQEADG